MVYLQDHIGCKLPVQRRVMVVGGLRPVGFGIPPVLAAVIDKAAPDDHPAEGAHRLRQHIGAFRVVPAVGERPGTAFAVRLDQETGQIGNRLPDPGRGFRPPGLHPGVQWVRGRDAVAHGLGIIHGDHQPDAEGTDNFRQPGQVGQVVLQQQLAREMNIDIIDTQHIQADGGHQAGDDPDPLRIVIQLSAAEKEAAAGIAPLHGAVWIVPAVDHPERIARSGFQPVWQFLAGGE